MIETASNDIFTQAFFKVANEINQIHLESGVKWGKITRYEKAKAEKDHGNLYFQTRKAQDQIDAAWKAQDMREFKKALEKWRLLWQAEVDLWKREMDQ